MDFKSILLAATVLVLSTSANSATITHGFLTTDDATDYITDITTQRIYKRFDTFNLSYADTIAAVSAGGIYEGWSIATSDIADDFYSAVLGVASTPCTGANVGGANCGQISGWNDNDFGVTFDSSNDYFWFLSTNTTPNREPYLIGLGNIRSTSDVNDYDDWGTEHQADGFGISNPASPINALIYREASVVPIPAAIWLFGSGLIGLVGVARRKKS